MASEDQVKRYLAYWFQLGKKLVINHGQDKWLPQPVIEGNRYSLEFETGWQRIASADPDAYLEGTEQTISDLLSDRWDMTDCARCSMPVPLMTLGGQSSSCPCFDLPFWPNTELPQPRSPVDSRTQLSNIHTRLVDCNQTAEHD